MQDKLPKQCQTCLLVGECIKEGCFKEKTCTSRLERKELDPDFVQEMRERAGI